MCTSALPPRISGSRLLILASSAALLVSACGGEDGEREQAHAQTEARAAPVAAEAEKTARVGGSHQYVGVGKKFRIEATLTKVRDPVKQLPDIGGGVITAVKGYRLVVVHLRLRNKGTGAIRVRRGSAIELTDRSVLIGSGGRRFRWFSSFEQQGAKGFGKPGGTLTAELRYAVPKKAKLRTFRLVLRSTAPGFGRESHEWGL